METFIVLGLCFILYEALDLFQSCYNKERHHHQHQQLHNHRHRRQRNYNFGNNPGCSTAIDNNIDDGVNVNSDFCIVGTSDDSVNINTINCDSINVNKDTAHLMRLDSISELDSDDNQTIHSDINKVYSICDRVINRQFDNDSYSANNIVCVDDNIKLIVG